MGPDSAASYNFNSRYIVPDGWKIGGLAETDLDTYTDAEWPGCDYRLVDQPGTAYAPAVNLTISGRKSHWDKVHGCWRTRVRIEYVQDGGEPSVFDSGWMYSPHPVDFEI